LERFGPVEHRGFKNRHPDDTRFEITTNDRMCAGPTFGRIKKV
jgi:hypothetical protein